VHRRIVLGVAAWLIGAGAATGGSLLAVNMLGQGMTPGGGEQQSVTTVNRALAKEAAARAAILPRRAGPRHAGPRHAGPWRLAAARPAARTATSSRAAGQAAAPGPPAGRASPGATGGTVLTSEGGTLVASCAGARAYLVSWSPQQGFWSAGVVRGPAASARATFTSGQLTVTMVVSCAAGAPAATTTAVGTGAAGTGAGAVSPFGGDGD
jgi:hypothetical protein